MYTAQTNKTAGKILDFDSQSYLVIIIFHSAHTYNDWRDIMEIIRIINDEPVKNKAMPQICIENPKVLDTIREVQYRIYEQTNTDTNDNTLS